MLLYAVFLHKLNKMREQALKILQDETGSFEEASRLRDDVLDAMIAFKVNANLSDEEIEKAASDDYKKQTKYDDGYDRKKGFKAGVKWVMSILKWCITNSYTKQKV
jgi:hypothetical protein